MVSNELYLQALEELRVWARKAVLVHAEKLNVSFDGLMGDLLRELRESDSDGRAIKWSARLRLYDLEHPNDPVADSDPDTPPGEPGEMVFHGLPGVADWVIELAAQYHQAPCVGLTAKYFATKIKGLRTQMSSRKDNTGVLRIEYTIQRKDLALIYMLARVDVVRLGEGPVAEKRKMPVTTFLKNNSI